MRLRWWEHLQAWVRKAPRLLPLIDSTLGARREDQRGLLGTMLAVGICPDVFQVVTANLVLGTVPAGVDVS